MKVTVALCAILACAAALPAHKSERDDILKTFFSPFGGEDSSVSSVSSESSEDDSGEPSGFSFFLPVPTFFINPMSIFPSLFRELASPDADPDTKLTNSTSETKYVNGQKVVMNHSIYENTRKNGVIWIDTIVWRGGSDSAEDTPSITDTAASTPETDPNRNEINREDLSDPNEPAPVDDLKA